MKRRKTGQRVTVEKKSIIVCIASILYSLWFCFFFRTRAISLSDPWPFNSTGSTERAHTLTCPCDFAWVLFIVTISVSLCVHLNICMLFRYLKTYFSRCFRSLTALILFWYYKLVLLLLSMYMSWAASSAFSYGHSVFVYAMPNN